MDNQKLEEANGLKALIEDLQLQLARVTDPGFFIQVRDNKSNTHSLILTVGVGEGCEHPLAPYATAFQAQIVAHYRKYLDEAQAAYAAL